MSVDKYAELVIKKGVNLQKNQLLVISSPLECADFARLLTEKAYKAGALDVVILWHDDLFSKIRYHQAPEEALDDFPLWKRLFYNSYLHYKAAFITIHSADPEVFNDVSQNRITRVQKANNSGLEKFRDQISKSIVSWCVVSVPTKAWATKVFPELAPNLAPEKLFQSILKTVRANEEDPIKAWDQHVKVLLKRRKFLNERQFRQIVFKNSLGTDITIDLPIGHVWLGGPKTNQDGVEFIANMPTEEVFTAPKRTGVNGTVVSTKALVYQGRIIENFSLTFKEGKVIDFRAETGEENLKALLETDEGSAYLGEVAIVPTDSPVAKTNLLFYNTLFDENASCHLALGKSYPTCIHNGRTMTAAQLSEKGLNLSSLHEDFMIGSEDMNIFGISETGNQVLLMDNGKILF